MLPLEFLAKGRSFYPVLPDKDLLALVEANVTINPDEQGHDVNDEFRWEVCVELSHSLGHEDHTFIRYLLEQDIKLHKVLWAVNSSIQLCVRMLYQFGKVEDSLLIWEAKTMNFDTSIAIDTEWMIGGGLDETRHFLKENGSQEALQALASIEERAQKGVFNTLDQRPIFRKIQLR